MLKALKHIRQFCAQTRFSTWLIQITVNEARMRRRRDHADIMEPMLDQMDEEGNYTPRDLADWREIPLETLERKENPSAACRRPGIAWAEVLRGFVLRDMQHLSIEETAITLGNSAASVKICLPHARLMLRDCQPQDCRQLEQQGVICKGTRGCPVVRGK